jgi:hypothetical protein
VEKKIWDQQPEPEQEPRQNGTVRNTVVDPTKISKAQPLKFWALLAEVGTASLTSKSANVKALQ